MSTTYMETLKQVRDLDLEDQLRLLEDISVLVRRHLASKSRRSILELRGLGKEIWEGVNAQAYVEQERASWNG